MACRASRLAIQPVNMPGRYWYCSSRGGRQGGGAAMACCALAGRRSQRAEGVAAGRQQAAS